MLDQLLRGDPRSITDEELDLLCGGGPVEDTLAFISGQCLLFSAE